MDVLNSGDHCLLANSRENSVAVAILMNTLLVLVVESASISGIAAIRNP
jgi:hypothetical protein